MKRAHDGQELGFSVRVVRNAEEHRYPAAAEVPVLEVELGRGPVDIVDPFKAQQLAATEQVGFLDAERGSVFATAAGKRDVRRQRPDVLRRDFHIHGAVFVANGLDPRVVYEAIRAHNALGFLEQPAGVGIAVLEQDLVADDLVAGDDVQSVGPPVEPFVFFRIGKIEYVALLEHDIADNGTSVLQFFVFWYRRGHDDLGATGNLRLTGAGVSSRHDEQEQQQG